MTAQGILEWGKNNYQLITVVFTKPNIKVKNAVIILN